MQARAGIIGGVFGGLFMLILDQSALVIGISSVNTMGELSRLLFGGTQTNPSIWGVHLLATGLVGWLVSRLIPEKNINSYVTLGILVGVILWVIMNIIFTLSGVITPTWSLGIGSFIVNLITHVVLGISITYTIWRYKARVTA